MPTDPRGEFSHPISADMLKNGLTRDEHLARDKNFLAECEMVVGYAGSLATVPNLVSAMAPDLPECEWPFPQVITTQRALFICTEQDIYTYSGGALNLIWSGDENYWRWTVLDHITDVWLANGQHVLRYNVAKGELTPEEPHGGEVDVGIPNFVCSTTYNGQSIIGGVTVPEPSLETPPSATSDQVWFSVPGEMNFSLDERNMSGRRSAGAHCDCLWMEKLGQKVIVFSSHGTDALYPADVGWGLEHLTDYGLFSQWAITRADEGTLWFIDSRRHLMEMNADGLRDHGCEMWFDVKEWVLSWDPRHKLLYICNGAEGFVYNPDEESLARGVAGISGITSSNLVVGNAGTVAPGAINVTTNWYDFGSRAYKTIQRVEYSMAVENARNCLQGAIDFRTDNESAWRTTPWKRICPSGILWTPCYGVEFRIRARSRGALTQQGHLDNIRVIGTIHGYDFLNAIGWAPNANSPTSAG